MKNQKMKIYNEELWRVKACNKKKKTKLKQRNKEAIL